jgi:glycosyltransferase involved in cell wall biosynthesis
MKLLYLAPDPVPAPKGAAVRIARTVRTLSRLGWEVELLTPAPALGERLAEVVHDTVELPEGNFLDRMLAFRAAAAQWLSGRSADLVQFRSIWEGMSALAWADRQGRPAVFEAHGFPSIELPYHFPALRRAPGLLEKLIREEAAALSAAALLITPSRTGALYLQSRGVSPGRVAVVPNCVDTDQFRPAPPPERDAPFRIVYQGTLAPWQGLEPLVEALTRFRGREVELHVVGPSRSAWRRSLGRFSRRCRVQRMLQHSPPTEQAALAPVMQTAHVCAAPLVADARNTVQGCCPIKLLEYMAAGRPILTTAIAPVEELLEHRRDAWLAAPGSPLALAEGIAWLMEHPAEREELGRRARGTAEERFGTELFRDRLGAALERALDYYSAPGGG